MNHSETAARDLSALEARLDGIHDPQLDALRAELPTMPTSMLLYLHVNGEALSDELDDESGSLRTAEDEAMRCGAASLCIQREIDRRFPVPGGPTPGAVARARARSR